MLPWWVCMALFFIGIIIGILVCALWAAEDADDNTEDTL